MISIFNLTGQVRAGVRSGDLVSLLPVALFVALVAALAITA